MFERAHVRIDVAYQKFGTRLRAWADLLAMLSMGYDPVWFGIMVVLLMETALITPPIGVNLFVVQDIRSKGTAFRDACVGAAPFVVAMRALVALLIWQPQIATWLPNQVYGR